MSTSDGLANVRGDVVQLESNYPDYKDLFNKLKTTFNSGKTKKLEWRKQQLQQMLKMLKENIDDFVDALAADLGRHKHMCLFGDLNSSAAHVKHNLENFKKWSAPRKVNTPFTMFPSKSYRLPQPKGVLLNISPWNFPVDLVFGPVSNMIAAGNCVVIKPSEVAHHVERVFARLIPQYMDTSAIACVTGGVPETTALLKLPWNHICYTGNGGVAKIVLKAAAQHLTPCTLELGGKSPVIVDSTCDIEMAVRRILNIKTFNCGQICICADYVLLHQDMEAAFYREVKKVMKEFYGKQGQKNHASYAKVIDERHWDRLADLLSETDAEGRSLHEARIRLGGLHLADRKTRFFPTTIVHNPPLDCKLMRYEIFGPILPVLTVPSVSRAVEIINDQEVPLALYIFSSDQKTIDRVLKDTSSGGVCVNDLLMHITVPELPFGGIGPSGMGAYHFKHGFDEFSHLRSVLHRPAQFDLIKGARYPPFSDQSAAQMRNMVLWGGPIPPHVVTALKRAVTALLGVSASYIAYTQLRASM